MLTEHYSLGRFGDRRLDKGGTALLEGMIVRASSCLRQAASGPRSEAVRYGRFLANGKVTLDALLAGWGEQTALAAASRHVLAIQDTSEINFRTTAERRRGLGEIGKGVGHGLLFMALANKACPREGGDGAHRLGAEIFPQYAVTIEGETRDYDGRFFCPRCGSSVFARSADEIEVNLGSLDAPDQLAPTYESWIVRREAWLPRFPLKRRYFRDREGTGRLEE